jgi:predicted aspartyl protease
VIDAPLLESANMGADGILGVDSLRYQRVLFDFEGQRMSVVPSKIREIANEPGAIVITAKSRKGRLIITEAKANGRRVTVVLDTGAQVSIGNSALRKQLLGRGVSDGPKQIELHSVTGGKIMGDYLFVREVEMGGVELSNLAIVFADAHTFKALGLDRKPALLLGMNALRAFKKVSIDFASRRARAQRERNEAGRTAVAAWRQPSSAPDRRPKCPTESLSRPTARGISSPFGAGSSAPSGTTATSPS